MVHNEEMEYTQEYIEATLGETGLYRDIKIGEKVDGINNKQKKRHLYAEREDGKEFLYIVNSDPINNQDLIEKFVSASTNGIYSMPVFYKNTNSSGEKVFMKWWEGIFKDTMRHHRYEDRQKAVETRKNERTAMNVMDGQVVYFDRQTPKLDINTFNFGITSNYEHLPEVPLDSRELKTVAVPERLYSTSTWSEEALVSRNVRSKRILYALPDPLDEMLEKVDEFEEAILRGDDDAADNIYDSIKNSEFVRETGMQPFRNRLEGSESRRPENGSDQLTLF